MGLYAPKATVTQTEFANNSSKSSLAKQHVCIIKKQIQFFAYYQYFIGINQYPMQTMACSHQVIRAWVC